MKLRNRIVWVAIAMLAYAATPLLSSSDASLDICCVDTDNCPGGYRCRYPDGAPCSPEAIGTCVPIIVN